jgi:hypothetical protein
MWEDQKNGAFSYLKDKILEEATRVDENAIIWWSDDPQV